MGPYLGMGSLGVSSPRDKYSYYRIYDDMPAQLLRKESALRLLGYARFTYHSTAHTQLMGGAYNDHCNPIPRAPNLDRLAFPPSVPTCCVSSLPPFQQIV